MSHQSFCFKKKLNRFYLVALVVMQAKVTVGPNISDNCARDKDNCPLAALIVILGRFIIVPRISGSHTRESGNSS